MLTRAAQSMGIKTNQYSCGQALLDGACGLAIAPQLCPVTCDLCSYRWLGPWTFIEGSPKSQEFCLASASSCDYTTNCGGHLTSARECQTASIALGLSSSVTELNDHAGPRGCFYVLEGPGLYWNPNGSQGSRYNFAKSLCRWQTTTGFTLPEPNGVETVVACGERRTLPVYYIAAQAFESALGALKIKQISKFMLKIREGEAYVHKQISFTGAEGGTVVVLAGAPSPDGFTPRTSLKLGGNHLVLTSGMNDLPISVCIQDLHLHSGKADKTGEEGGAILAWTSELSARSSKLSLVRCHIENCMSRLSGGALVALRLNLKVSHCVFRNNGCLCMCLSVYHV